MMKDNPYKTATYLTSAAEIKQLPPDEGIEVAIVGRSNVGKSTALNKLTQNKHLAKVSKLPGRTQLINLFAIDSERRIVDLPGYGYAKIPEAIKQRFAKTLPAYFQTRQCLKGLILLIDIRRLLGPLDEQMIQLAQSVQLPIHVLLTKADKLGQVKARQALAHCKKQLTAYSDISIQLFSATNHFGIDIAVEKLNQWFDLG